MCSGFGRKEQPAIGVKPIYFMKIGQPKLSKRNGQKSGLFAPPNVGLDIGRGSDDDRSKEW
jgi:hypothetical protein